MRIVIKVIYVLINILIKIMSVAFGRHLLKHHLYFVSRLASEVHGTHDVEW